MDKDNFEEKIFELISQMVVSARNLLDEPQHYGPLRLVDSISQFVTILEEAGMSSDRLNAIRDKIEEGKFSSMGTPEEFEEFLESTVSIVVDMIDE